MSDCLQIPVLYSPGQNFQARTLEWIAFPSPGDLSNSGSNPDLPHLQAGCLPTELSGKLPYTHAHILQRITQFKGVINKHFSKYYFLIKKKTSK